MVKQSTFRILDYYNLDFIDYKEAWDLQKETFEQRNNNEINDTIFLLEHPHTYTLGKSADKNNLIGNDEYLKKNKISVYDIDRGGDITYHGPGQIVGYPIIDLKNWHQDSHKYLRALEEVLIKTCAGYGLNAERNDKYTGVWIDDRKIAAIGIKISKWITMHGFAFNVKTNLSFFGGIIPCGISEKGVTSLESELNETLSIEEVKENILTNFKKVLNYENINYLKRSVQTETV